MAPLVTMPSHDIIWVNGLSVAIASAAGQDPDRKTHNTTALMLTNGANVTVRGNVDAVLRCLAGDEEAANAYYEVYVEPAMEAGTKQIIEPKTPPLVIPS